MEFIKVKNWPFQINCTTSRRLGGQILEGKQVKNGRNSFYEGHKKGRMDIL